MIKETILTKLPILNKDYEVLNYKVEDIVYCFKEFKVLGLYLQNIDSTKRKKIIPYFKIKNITEEGIIINSLYDIVNIEANLEIKHAIDNYKPMIGYEIYSEKNEIIGIVRDPLIRIQNGKVLGLIISEGIFDDLINGYSFLPLVKDFNFEEYKIMLTDKEELKILSQQGGLKKILGIYKEN